MRISWKHLPFLLQTVPSTNNSLTGCINCQNEISSLESQSFKGKNINGSSNVGFHPFSSSRR